MFLLLFKVFFSTNFFVIDLHGSDLVLVVVWLAILGPSTTDYVNRLFDFNISGQRICWVGDPVSSSTQINMSTIRRFSQIDAISYLLRLDFHSTSTTSLPDYPQDLSLLLQSYDDVFKSPESLNPLDLRTTIFHCFRVLIQLMYILINTPIFRRLKLNAKCTKCLSMVLSVLVQVLILPMFY